MYVFEKREHLKSITTLFIIYYLLFHTILIKPLKGQNPDHENLLDTESESEDQTDLLEYLNHILENPIDLNSATFPELQSLPWLSPQLAHEILKHRKSKGSFMDKLELLSVKGMHPDLMHTLSQFVYVKDKKREIDFHLTGRQRIRFTREKNKGLINGSYAGDEYKIYNRLKGCAGDHIKFGLLFEKDPGEKQLNDLTIGYSEIKLPKYNVQVNLGHYIAEFGQGLVFSSPYRLKKSNAPLAPVKQRSRNIVSYASVDENFALYGTALHYLRKKLELTTFISKAKKDASVQKDSVSSIPKTGYHRTQYERECKDKLLENIMGLNVKYHVPKLGSIEYSHLSLAYDKVIKQKTGIENEFAFHGSTCVVRGLAFDISSKSINIFSEIANSNSRAWALVGGLLLDLSRFSWTLSFRHFDVNFYNPHGRGFGIRGTTLNNEQGLYTGWRYRPGPRTKISFYFDQYRFPWPSYQTSMPLTGWQIMGLLEQNLSKKLLLTLRIKKSLNKDSKKYSDPLGNMHSKISDHEKTNVRLQIDYKISKRMQCRTRFEYNHYHVTSYSTMSTPQIDNIGYLIYQDYSLNKAPWFRLKVRWTFFEAPFYDVRFYQYEQDLPGIMRLKLLYGHGSRMYLLLQFPVQKSIRISTKYEHTLYDDRNIIGTGNDEIPSNNVNTISLQLDWKF